MGKALNIILLTMCIIMKILGSWIPAHIRSKELEPKIVNNL